MACLRIFLVLGSVVPLQTGVLQFDPKQRRRPLLVDRRSIEFVVDCHERAGFFFHGFPPIQIEADGDVPAEPLILGFFKGVHGLLEVSYFFEDAVDSLS